MVEFELEIFGLECLSGLCHARFACGKGSAGKWNLWAACKKIASKRGRGTVTAHYAIKRSKTQLAMSSSLLVSRVTVYIL